MVFKTLFSKVRLLATPLGAAWIVIFLTGVLFFWMNTRLPPARRGDLFWSFNVFAHWPDRFCDLRITLAFLESDYKGVPIQPGCQTPPSLIYGEGAVWLGRVLLLNRLTVDDATPLGFLMAGVTLACIALISRVRSKRQVAYLALLLLSPPTMLGLERGNIDLAFFCLMIAAMWLCVRYGEAFSHPVLFAIGTVKYYPFVALLGLLRPTRRSWKAALIFSAVVLVFMAFALSGAMAAAKIGSATFAWGFRVVFELMPEMLLPEGYEISPWSLREMLLIIGPLTLIVALLGWLRREKLQAFLQAEEEQTRMRFLTGCAIYSGCFLLSINYEYRNIFLFLMLPHLFLRSRGDADPSGMSRWMLRVILGAFLLSWGRSLTFYFLLGQACYWALFCLTTPVCVAALAAAWPKEWRAAKPS